MDGNNTRKILAKSFAPETLKIGDIVKLRKREFGEPLIYGSKGKFALRGGTVVVIKSFGMKDIEIENDEYGTAKITIQDIE